MRFGPPFHPADSARTNQRGPSGRSERCVGWLRNCFCWHCARGTACVIARTSPAFPMNSVPCPFFDHGARLILVEGRAPLRGGHPHLSILATLPSMVLGWRTRTPLLAQMGAWRAWRVRPPACRSLPAWLWSPARKCNMRARSLARPAIYRSEGSGLSVNPPLGYCTPPWVFAERRPGVRHESP